MSNQNSHQIHLANKKLSHRRCVAIKADRAHFTGELHKEQEGCQVSISLQSNRSVGLIRFVKLLHSYFSSSETEECKDRPCCESVQCNFEGPCGQGV